MEGLPALIEVAKSVAPAFAWVVTVAGVILLAIARVAQNSYAQVIRAKDSVIEAKDARIEDLEGRMSQTLADHQARQREQLEALVEKLTSEKEQLQEVIETLKKERDEAKAHHLAWQKQYEEVVAKIGEPPPSDVSVIDTTIERLEDLQAERATRLQKAIASVWALPTVVVRGERFDGKRTSYRVSANLRPIKGDTFADNVQRFIAEAANFQWAMTASYGESGAIESVLIYIQTTPIVNTRTKVKALEELAKKHNVILESVTFLPISEGAMQTGMPRP